MRGAGQTTSGGSSVLGSGVGVTNTMIAGNALGAAQIANAALGANGATLPNAASVAPDHYLASCGGDNSGISQGAVPPAPSSCGGSTPPPPPKDPKPYLERTSTPQGELELLREAMSGSEEGREWMNMVRLGHQGYAGYADLVSRPLVQQLLGMSQSILAPRPDNFTSEDRTPWGGSRIVDEVKAKLNLSKRPRIVGESWEISSHPSFPNTFMTSYAGQQFPVSLPVLGELFPEEVYGEHAIPVHGEGMPFLVKLLNSGSWGEYLAEMRPLLENLDTRSNADAWRRDVAVRNSLTEVLDRNYHDLHQAITRLEQRVLSATLQTVSELRNASRWAQGLELLSLLDLRKFSGARLISSLKLLNRMMLSDGSTVEAQRVAEVEQLVQLHQKMLSKNLSVQVHPSSSYDGLAEGEHSKTEAWTIVGSEPGAGIYLGLKDNVTRDEFQAAMRNGEDVSAYLNFVEVNPGDVFFIPAGTMHAIGAGVLLVEPQETSETTYRVYDWGRVDANGKPRKLHIDSAVAVTEWDGLRGDAAVNGYRRVPEIIPPTRENSARVERLLKESVFEQSRIAFRKGDEYKGSGKPGVKGFTVIDGEVEVVSREQNVTMSFARGQSFIIPAGMGNYLVRGMSDTSTVIKTSTSLPIDANDSKPTSSVSSVIKTQNADIQARNAAFVVNDAPHVLLINTQGYAGPRVPKGATDSGGQLTYINAKAVEMARQGYKVTIVARAFVPEEEFASFGDRRGVAFMPGTNNMVRFVFVPGAQEEGATIIRKEDLYPELPFIGRNLAHFISEEASSLGKHPWEYVRWIDSHYVDAGVVGQRLIRNWQHEVIANHVRERFGAILPQHGHSEGLDDNNLTSNLPFHFGRCVLKAWLDEQGIEDGPGLGGDTLDERAVMRWVGGKLGWDENRMESILRRIGLSPENPSIPSRETIEFGIGYRLMEEAGDRGHLDKKLYAVHLMHVWTPHSLGKLKEQRMILAGESKLKPGEFRSMNFETRETFERGLVSGAMSGVDRSSMMFSNGQFPPAAGVGETSDEIRQTAFLLGMSAAMPTIRFEPGTDSSLYFPRESVEDPDIRALFSYFGQSRVSAEELAKMLLDPKKFKLDTFESLEEAEDYFSDTNVPQDIIDDMMAHPQRYNVVVEAGRMDETKRKQVLIEAMHYLPDDTVLFITGKRDKAGVYDNLRKEIKRLGLERRVFLVGMVPDELMGPIMSLPHGTADSQFRLGIISSASRMEGWGMAVQDGTRGGMALVASDCTPYAMHLARTNEAARIIKVGSENEPQQYAQEIQRLRDNPPEARKLAKRGLEIARQYEWGPLTQRFIRQVEGLLLGGSAVFRSSEMVRRDSQAQSLTEPQLHVVVLGGGSGTRFGPYSTPERPKQFLPITRPDRTMLQETVDRFRDVVPMQNIWVSTNERYLPLVREQEPQVMASNIVGEPMAKNTAPAIATLMYRIAMQDPRAIAVVVSSDHFIESSEVFLNHVHDAAAFAAANGALVTFGIPPTWPSPEYGYIEQGARLQEGGKTFRVERFVEKPDAERAQRYLEQNRDAHQNHFLWNSGMFVWQVGTFLAHLKRHQPIMHAGLGAVYDGEPLGHPLSVAAMTRYFRPLEKISIDYALMEPAAVEGDVAVIPFETAWSDVGTWEGLDRLVRSGRANPPKQVLEIMEQKLAGNAR